ncbi:hypothetical protein J2I47_24600 [Fibrella sp. HMF5335]|uniref:DUF4426 domain-containing protein n=1 Tax=Fibrella rubiginis TaxID=2817060 RepID=A0A939GLV8_9BACT|nr:hypothetical protein [Fibrella rubiginis]MBO0939749.1 hypothetical protein [Fibrella rubiginis]
MKLILPFILLLTLLSGCSTSGDNIAPQPDRARRMSGTYLLNYMSVQNGSQPAVSTALPLQMNGKELLSATISITRKTESTVDVAMSLTIDQTLADQIRLNPKDLTNVVQPMEIRDNGGGYDLYNQSQKVARYDNDTFIMQLEAKNPQTGEVFKTEFRGTKQP